LYNSGGVIQETEFTDVQLNTKPAESVFQGPDGFEKLEAPEQIIYGNTSVQALAKIKETAPGKPIKYLVLTHHHADHAGGFREYVGEGATIVTTSATKSFLEKAARAESSLLPKFSTQKLTVETIANKKRVFQDDKHVVEIYDIGPNPHANEMLVVYLPKEKILFQADLLNPAANGTIPIAQDTTVSFGERLKQMGLQVEKIYGVHGRAATPEELWTSIEKRRTSELKLSSAQ
jgi:glyoxylase-like metal-dependent hydrolase (beta-lactamase superfamily II)